MIILNSGKDPTKHSGDMQKHLSRAEVNIDSSTIRIGFACISQS